MVSGSVCFLTLLCLASVAFLEMQNLRVEIVPDGPTSFVETTTVMSVITDSDYNTAAVLRQPLALSQAGDRSSHRC